MRIKRTLNCWFWFIIYLLPLFGLFIYGIAARTMPGEQTLEAWFTSFLGLFGTGSDIVTSTIKQIYALFEWNSTILNVLAAYAAYFVYVNVIRVMIALIMFLIDIAERFIGRLID